MVIIFCKTVYLFYRMKKDSFIPLAQKVMEKVMKHPCARPFMAPLVPGENCPDDYLEVIKNPIDLSTINKQLKAKKYRSFKEWYNSVSLIWSNVKSYYEEDDFMITMADEVETIFENELQSQKIYQNVDDWWKEVIRLQEKIGKLNNNPPEKIAYSFSGLSPTKKLSNQLYTNKEVKQFIHAVKLMKNPTDQEDLINIIGDMQPELKSNGNTVNVDVYKLCPTTFVAAKEYVRNTLKNEEIEYPK